MRFGFRANNVWNLGFRVYLIKCRVVVGVRI